MGVPANGRRVSQFLHGPRPMDVEIPAAFLRVRSESSLTLCDWVRDDSDPAGEQAPDGVERQAAARGPGGAGDVDHVGAESGGAAEEAVQQVTIVGAIALQAVGHPRHIRMQQQYRSPRRAAAACSIQAGHHW